MLLAQKNYLALGSGVIFPLFLALLSHYITSVIWVKNHGWSPMVIAMILGMLYGSTLRQYLPHTWTPGIQFCAKKILRLAIVLYGFRLTFQEVAQVGMHGFFLDLLMVALTMVLGALVGIKVFKLDRDLALLISSGAAICGAAAVLATEGVLKSEPYKATFAVITVVLFGTIAMFLYPCLQHLHFFGFNNVQYGVYTGATMYEVAQVVVAGAAVSPESSNIAMILKMTRVMLLAPMLLILSAYLTRVTTMLRVNKQDKRRSAYHNIPWFAVLFIIVVIFNSLDILPYHLMTSINHLDIFLLTMAMAALGIETNFSTVKKVGLKSLYFAFFLFIWLMSAGYLLQQLL